MKITTQKSKEHKNKIILDIEVPQETVRKKFDEVYGKIGEEAKVPGFRQGKAPRHVLEQHHGKAAREEVIKGLISETYQAGLKSENIDAIDLPEITDVKFDASTLSYKATVEIKPEVNIKQYKGLKLKKNEIKVEPAEIENYVKQLKESRQDAADAPEEKLARGLGYKTKEEFLGCLRMQIYLKKENDERARLEKELIRQLLANSSFTVPRSLVEKRLKELEEEAVYRMSEYGLTEEKMRQRLKELGPKFQADAEEQVKVFLVLEAVAKSEHIKHDDHMVRRAMEFVFAEADWS